MPNLAFLLFPVLVAAGGVYLILRGNKLRSAVILSGKGQPKQPVMSVVGRKPCIYSNTILEERTDGPTPWKKIFSREQGSTFSINNRTISNAQFFATQSTIYEGVLPSQPGLINKILQPVLESIGVVNQPLDKEVLSALSSIPVLEKLLKRFGGKYVRVTEFAIPQDATLHIVYAGVGDVLEYPALVFENEGAASSAVRDRSSLAFVLGAGCFILAIALLFLIF